MKLYVLNPSSQKLQMTFRVPGEKQVRFKEIGPGQQEVVYDGPPDSVYAIIGQNEVYGLIEDTDVRAKQKGFTGSIFAIDRVVDIKAAKIAERQNNDALIHRGEEIRKVSAIAAADVVAARLRGAGFSEAHMQDTMLGLRGEDEEGQPVVLNEETTVRKGPNPKPWSK